MKFLSKLTKKDIQGKTVLVRVDLNIKDGKELFRLDAIIPTLKYILEKGVKKIIVVSHRGRPERSLKFKVKSSKESLEGFTPLIARSMKTEVDFVSANRIATLIKAAKESDAQIVLLENIRFFSGEMKNDSSFAKVFVSCADVYVNDALAVSHRKHASVEAVTKLLPSYAGLLLEQEMLHLDKVIESSKHPFVLVIGGAKISDKVGVIERFKNKADRILLGGGAANTFFAAEGFPVGDSLHEPTSIPEIKKYIGGKNIFIPVDTRIFKTSILDVGSATSSLYTSIIQSARTVVWSGPMGFFEKRGFENGTREMWKAILSNKRANIVVGGGETIAASRLIPNFKSKISKMPNIFLSTGGGAMLVYLSGEKLPGIEALEKSKIKKND